MESYSYKRTFLKGLKYFIIFGLPFLVNQFIIAFPEWANLPIGSALVMLVNFAKTKVGIRII